MMEYVERPDAQPTTALVLRAAERLAALIQDCDDAAARPVAASPMWTIHDVIAHVATLGPRYQAGVEGAGRYADHPRTVAVLNAEALTDHVCGRSVAELADAIVTGATAYADAVASVPRGTVFPFHLGVPMTGGQVGGVFLGELLVHGHDIARTLGHRWSLPPDEVGAVFDSLEPLLPGWVDPDRSTGHSATYELRLRGAGVYRWRFDSGALTTGIRQDARIDCHIAGTAGSMLLVLYRRISAVRAAATGRALAWGRRPWLAFSLADRFYEV